MKLMNTIICRTPAFGIHDDLADNWDNLKSLIKESSPEFFQLIRHLDYNELIDADQKARFTVWKYFNRARYRSTPFGRFGAISFIPLSDSDGVLKVKNQMQLRHFIDWRHKDLIHYTFTGSQFISNSTWYKVGPQIRYIKFIDDHFELAVIKSFSVVEGVLGFCRYVKDRSSLLNFIGVQYNLSKADSLNLISQMVGNQLLMGEQVANITGVDYFRRLKINFETKDYIIAERQLESGSISPVPFHSLPAYFKFIKAFIPQQESKDLAEFKEAFSRKFDLNIVPLSHALDPETGVGYGEYANEPDNTNIGEIFKHLEDSNGIKNSVMLIEQGKFLLNQIMKGGEIQLEEYIHDNQSIVRECANTISVMCRLHKGAPVIENAGGCTANALIGRFTLGGGEALEICKEITKIESDANPGIVFFDVAYQAERNVDNVNRREDCYATELPLLTWSCHKLPLAMEDILLCVRHGEVVLWSKQHQCRIVPRIASAYNYNRSDLAVYRFLCDLQFQQLATDLTFRVESFLPGLDHYPRIMFKNIIVSPARWKFDNKIKEMDRIVSWLKEKGIRFPFKAGKADQFLQFDPACKEDMQAFTEYVMQQKDNEIILSETLASDTIKGAESTEFAAQYILNYSHTNTIYRPFNLNEAVSRDNFYSPGSEWLYLEIYCHPLRSQEILFLAEDLIKLKMQLIKQWFFIRYNDPTYHIRLRFQLKDAIYAGEILKEINTLLNPLSQAGLVRDIQVKTYAREVVRYGAEKIATVEYSFYEDSKMILKLLSKYETIHNLQVHTLKFMEAVIELSGIQDKNAFIRKMVDSFTKEFHLKGEVFKKINNSYKTIKNNLDAINLNMTKIYRNTCAEIFKRCEVKEKESMAANLIHMHINRLFHTKQRIHEAVLYNYLLKLNIEAQYHQDNVQVI